MSLTGWIKIAIGVGGAILLYILVQQLRAHLAEYDRRGQAEAVESWKAEDLQKRLLEEEKLRKAVEQQRDDARAIGDTNEAQRVERTVVYKTIREEIKNAPPSDDAVAAPVLQRTISLLYDPKAGSQDPDEGSRP